MYGRFLTSAALLVAISLPAHAGALSEAERSSLQATMIQFIDRQAIDGAFLKLDLKTGDIRKFVPSKSHPMIMRMGQNYVLCTEFKDMDGKATDVDFYVAANGRRFTIFRTEIDNRAPLMDLVKAGRAVAAE